MGNEQLPRNVKRGGELRNYIGTEGFSLESPSKFKTYPSTHVYIITPTLRDA